MKIVDKEFFKVPVLELCMRLLGKIISRQFPDGVVRYFRIMEVEAYGGGLDTASHASRGKTKRNALMFEAGGILYVYLCYGIFDLVNIVSGIAGSAEGVMLRGVQEIGNNGEALKRVEGPGRTSKLMEMTREFNWEDLIESTKIWIEEDGYVVGEVEALSRVGIGYAAKECQEKLWRFRIN